MVVARVVSLFSRGADQTSQIHICADTVNSEIFARILFSRIALKDIFATLEIRD